VILTSTAGKSQDYVAFAMLLDVRHIDARTRVLMFIPARPFPFILLCIPPTVSSVSKFVRDSVRTLSDAVNAISIHLPRSNVGFNPSRKHIET